MHGTRSGVARQTGEVSPLVKPDLPLFQNSLLRGVPIKTRGPRITVVPDVAATAAGAGVAEAEAVAAVATAAGSANAKKGIISLV